MDKQLVFLVQSLEQPRVIKRIIEKAGNYDHIKIFAFRRKIYRVNNFSLLDEFENIDYEIVGTFDNDSTVLRIILYLKLLILAYWKLGFKKKIIYTFGLDLRFLCFLIPNKIVFYEISDIIWLYKSKKIRYLLRNIDFFLSKRSNKVIFTSKGFYNSYFSFLDPKKIKIKENKFKTYNKVKPINTVLTDKKRIAYIGAFRYPEIMNSLIEASIKNESKVVLSFYGDGPENVISEIKKFVLNHQNIHYFGAFKNPDDLQKIYEENNLNFVAYDNSLDNEKVAMPNKFYESGFFNIPIICSKNTYVGERVEELQMGWTIDPTLDGIEDFLHNINLDEIVRVHNSIKEIDKDNFQFT